MISIIVAIAEHDAIGAKGDLLCHLPNDLKHFKAITSGHTVMMGERTYYSLPKRPLPNRKNIVLTDVSGKTFAGAQAVYSIDALTREADGESFVIGGGMVYRQMLPYADKLYITHIHHTFPEADTFFAIDWQQWQCVSTEYHEADVTNPYPSTFAEYVRK